MLNEDRLKPAKTIDELIDLIISRGLIIRNRQRAQVMLSIIGYYRLSAYCLGLQENNIFHTDISLDKIFHIYKFDEGLRKLLFAVIEPIEIRLRAEISNHLGIKYGNICYYDKHIANNCDMHHNFINLHKKSLKDNRDLAFVKHNLEKYGKLPIWAAVEIWSFGTLSKFYGNLLREDQRIIAKNFGIEVEYLKSWFECLCYVRNVCAHSGRIYNRIITKRPKLFNDDMVFYHNHMKIFPLIIIIYRLYHGRGFAWQNFYKELIKLIDEHRNSIKLSFIGFPEEWRSILIGKHKNTSSYLM